MAHFERLFSPGRIANLELRNRLAMSPMTTNYATSEGKMTDQLYNYYLARARGGVGLIIVEGAVIHPRGRGFAYELGAWDDSHVPGLQRLAEGIKAEGARTILQLLHCGRQCSAAAAGGQPVAPSPIPCPRIGEVPKELTVQEIGEIELAFALAAARAKKAGFDGIQLHGGSGYLLTQFLSPQANRRTDAYGGSLENRARMVLETIDLVKRTAGKDSPIFYRLCADEFLDGGTDLEESKVTAKLLEKAGVVALDVVGGTYGSTRSPSGPTGTPKAFFVYMAEAIKQVVSIPVMTVGGIYEPAVAEQILESGKADFILLGRGLLTDPDFPLKAKAGRSEEIVPCFRCLTCTPGPVVRDSRCPVNPALGNEDEFALKPALKPKKVLVIGSGIPALEAARRAALRGHKVSILEEGGSLGGLMGLRARVPKLGELDDVVKYFSGQIARLGVNVRKGEKATPGAISGFDAVLVASSGPPKGAEIPGLAPGMLYQGKDVIEDPSALASGSGLVAVVGTGLFGGETALFVAEQGKKVAFLDPAKDVAPAVAPATRGLLLAGLKARGVDIRTSSVPQSFARGTLRVLRDGVEEEVKDIAQVVLALGFEGPQGLAESMQKKAPEVHCVADAYEPLPLTEAVYQAAKIANSL